MNCPLVYQLVCPTCSIPIDSHPASRCLDVWVAKEVMGLNLPNDRLDYHKTRNGIGWEAMSPDYAANGEWLRSWTQIEWPAHYSTSIYCAWQVLEEMWREDEKTNKLRWWPDIFRIPASGEWLADLVLLDRDDIAYEGRATTIELAICIAALKASASQEVECVA